MRQFSLLDQIEEELQSHPLPAPADTGQAGRGFDDWSSAIAATEHDDLVTATARPIGKALLSSLFGNSPFLGKCVIRDPGFFADLISQPPDATLATIFHDMEFSHYADRPVSELMASLRRKKHHVSLLTAIADITTLWTVEQVTGALSEFAERATQLAVSRLLADQATAGNLDLPWLSDPEIEDPAIGSGFTVLGMGKLGGRELNYSSDIDLIILYDDENIRYTGDRSLGECMVRLTRELVTIMQKRTVDGYVFRTDLRLRPDPRATPPALSMSAAEIYYESTGLNWERAAMIKARPIAGDEITGNEFLNRISQFVWRKHLDFAAVQDIHAIKHQIHRHHKHGDISVLGHDVKLGRGGIREIEFIAQAHQLISGGRDVRLRARGTCKVLAILTETGHMEADAAQELTAAYRFLRTLEHRIQMVNDEQRHDLPNSTEGLAHISGFMGFDNVDNFCEEVLGHLRTVHRHYQRVFDDDVPQGEGALAQIANVGESDPAAIQTLTDLKFANPEQALAIIHGWNQAPYRAMRYERARALLSDLVPPLLTAVSKTADPDGALRHFDGFLGVLPEGVQLFSLLHANHWLLDLLAEIMGSAPRLATLLGRNTGLLDSVLGTEFLEPLPDPSVLADDLEKTLDQARDYQDILDLSRSWANDHRFRIGIQVLRNTVSPTQASRSQSDLADVIVRALLPRVIGEFSIQHGTFPNSDMCVLAFGKLGGQEMTFTSDLDLVFLYRIEEAEQSDGPKPLSPGTYFARLSQRFINALSAPTGEGRLYEVDMRLRPSGQSGPIAQTIEGFAKYQRESAWTWEHMALTRARVVSAGHELKHDVEAVVQSVLVTPRPAGGLVVDVAEMRRKLRQEFGKDDIWSIKHTPGGLLDVEFIVQYLTLKHASENTELLCTNTGDSLHQLTKAGVLSESQSQLLLEAFHLYTAVQSLIRLCTENGFDENTAPPDFRSALAHAAGTSDFNSLTQLLQDVEANVYSYFDELIVQPAAKEADIQNARIQD